VFERLLDLILQAGEQLIPFFVVDVYQQACVLRLGKYHRTVTPGFHWKIPFVERPIEVVTCMTTMRLPPQTLTTKDGKAIVVAAVIRYKLRDIEPYISLVIDQHDALADVTMGHVRAHVREMTFEELLSEPPEGKIATAVRRQVGRYGFDVEAVTFTDLAAVRSFRLIQASPKDLDN
jgi:regulator of protease activity HflC (stomatin/prohibitin superfamily)